MIKYKLRCRCTSEFEGWFPSSKDFTKQKKKGLLRCPMCDSIQVDKAIMAPGVIKIQKTQLAGDQTILGQQAEIILRQLNKKIKKEFQNVGKNFAKEARKAVKGNRDEKFYGTTSKEESKKLLEEGIDLFQLPDIKDN
jgi:hypothetical protein